MKQELRLYVAGDDFVSRSAVSNLGRIADEIGPNVHVSVIDIVETPESLSEMRVLATPMLVRLSPGPVCKVVGDLADIPRVLAVLGIQSNEKGAQEVL